MIFSIVVTLSLMGILLGLGYLFLTWNFDYWSKRGIKGPKPTPFYGNFPGMVTHKRNMAYDMQDIYNQFHQDEDFVGVFMLRTPQLLILSPEFVHKVFVTEFKSIHDNEAATWFDPKNDKIMANNPFILRGEEWKERRQEITPGITTSRIKVMYPVTLEVLEKLTQYIKHVSMKADKNGIDAKDLSLRFTSEVVTDSVLGIKAESLSDNPTPILGMTKKLFETTTFFSTYSLIAGFCPFIKKLYKAKFFPADTEEFFTGLLKSALDMRRNKKTDRMDFLNYLLQVQERKQFPNEQLLSHMMTFLIDGFETSATVITTCLLQLAKNPTAQEKLRQEVLSKLNKNGQLDFETLEGQTYIDQCLYESMRIIPPIIFSKKLVSEPIELTSRNGVKIQLKRDDVVLIPGFALVHDPQFFPNPDEFIPERFNQENGGLKKYRDMNVFFPFGDGPRMCLGMKFALIQTKAAIAEIVKNFNVKLNTRTKKENTLSPTCFLGGIEGGVWLDFEVVSPPKMRDY